MAINNACLWRSLCRPRLPIGHPSIVINHAAEDPNESTPNMQQIDAPQLAATIKIPAQQTNQCEKNTHMFLKHSKSKATKRPMRLL